MQKYTLRKPKPGSGLANFHVFEATSITNGKCRSETKSICSKAKRDDTDAVTECICVGEDKIRSVSAKIGREVCGVCMSEMYGDDD